MFDMVNRGALWKVLRIYDTDSKLLNIISDMYVNNIARVTAKEGESECLRPDSGARQGHWVIKENGA